MVENKHEEDLPKNYSDNNQVLDMSNLVDNSITELDRQLRQILTILHLPSENIVQPISERGKVFKNLESVINEISSNKESMTYLSKFIHAVADGLFDAALNYLWDATVSELRTRISEFDIEYFYDVAVTNTEKREKLKGSGDLVKVQDSDLLVGAEKIELLDKISLHELNEIRFMRNWASSAHPNNAELTGYKLVDWLETCIYKVFNIPRSKLNLEIKKLLSDIKTRSFSNEEVNMKKQLFSSLKGNQPNILISGLFGIYVSEKATSETRVNISKLIEPLWSLGSDKTKVKIGTNFGNYSINGHVEKAKHAREFLEIVNGQAYIPKDLKISEISNILSDLKSANDNSDNFYSEPPLSAQLVSFVDKYGTLPEEIENEYITTVVYCFITNGFGIAWNADDNYKLMINKFTPDQAIKAMLSYTDSAISIKLGHTLCVKKYKELLSLVKPKIINETPKKLIDFIVNFQGVPLVKFVDDSRYIRDFKQFVNNYSNKQ
ncbi:hypothetical protein Lpp48_00040 [Lacticaseibacillus paracasei subsp. paracasei Lpp48]|nr:hypothetical protein Lpp48_00040 [Lacticaseibacillus paracasei subsp. paracasei Lpp48]